MAVKLRQNLHDAEWALLWCTGHVSLSSDYSFEQPHVQRQIRPQSSNSAFQVVKCIRQSFQLAVLPVESCILMLPILLRQRMGLPKSLQREPNTSTRRFDVLCVMPAWRDCRHVNCLAWATSPQLEAARKDPISVQS